MIAEESLAWHQPSTSEQARSFGLIVPIWSDHSEHIVMSKIILICLCSRACRNIWSCCNFFPLSYLWRRDLAEVWSVGALGGIVLTSTQHVSWRGKVKRKDTAVQLAMHSRFDSLRVKVCRIEAKVDFIHNVIIRTSKLKDQYSVLEIKI